MHTPAFILVTCVQEDARATTITGRSVAFPVAKSKDGKFIFASCEHTITRHIQLGLQVTMTYSDGIYLPGDDKMRNNVIHPSFNSDLCFFELELDRDLPLVRLSRKDKIVGTTVSHIRNTGFKEECLEPRFEVTTQTPSRNNGKYFQMYEKFHRTADFVGAIPKSPHRGINIKSWPGVSGSPLWDRFGNVLGMVAGGTGENLAQGVDPNLVYLPSSEIIFHIRNSIQDRI